MFPEEMKIYLSFYYLKFYLKLFEIIFYYLKPILYSISKFYILFYIETNSII